MFWIGILVGILIWQIATLIFNFIWQDHEDRVLIASTALPIGIAILVARIYTALRAKWKAHNYKALVRDEWGELYYCESKDATYYTQHEYTIATDIRETYENDLQWWLKEDLQFNMPNPRYTSIKLVKQLEAKPLAKRKD